MQLVAHQGMSIAAICTQLFAPSLLVAMPEPNATVTMTDGGSRKGWRPRGARSSSVQDSAEKACQGKLSRVRFRSSQSPILVHARCSFCGS
jgi:hypothetical protein